MASRPRRMRLILMSAAVLLAAPALSGALPVPDPTVQAKHDTEAVVLTGADLAGWSVPANQTAKLPLLELPSRSSASPTTRPATRHNDYAKPEVDTQDARRPGGNAGGPAARLPLGRATRRFVQIPFQVDEMFTRYLDNSASGFAFYSGEDQHTTYAYDREGFRFYESDPDNPCVARRRTAVADTPDPVQGLDTNDELVFMADDAGPQAPRTAPLPPGIEERAAST